MTVVQVAPARQKAQQSADLAEYAKIRAKVTAREPHGPSTIMTFTSGLARLILNGDPDVKGDYGLNSMNRPKKSAKITEFMEYMLKGDWKLTGDTVKFSDKYLRDGQNRLEACARSGVPLTTHVVFGLDDHIFPFLDNGKTRSVSDAFAIAGVQNSGTVAGAVRWLEKFKNDGLKDRSGLTQDSGIKALEGYDPNRLKEAVAAARAVYAADSTPRTVSTALYYEFAKRDHSLAKEFFEAWASRNWGGRMRPIKKASEHLAALHQASNGRVHELARIAAWIAAWNLVVARRIGIKNDFRWRPEDPMPKIKGKEKQA